MRLSCWCRHSFILLLVAAAITIQGDQKNLAVNAVAATKLPSSDTVGINSKPDAYVTVTVGSTTFQSPRIDDDNDPSWNFERTFPISDEATAQISYEIKDYNFGADDRLIIRVTTKSGMLRSYQKGVRRYLRFPLFPTITADTQAFLYTQIEALNFGTNTQTLSQTMVLTQSSSSSQSPTQEGNTLTVSSSDFTITKIITRSQGTAASGHSSSISSDGLTRIPTASSPSLASWSTTINNPGSPTRSSSTKLLSSLSREWQAVSSHSASGFLKSISFSQIQTQTRTARHISTESLELTSSSGSSLSLQTASDPVTLSNTVPVVTQRSMIDKSSLTQTVLIRCPSWLQSSADQQSVAEKGEENNFGLEVAEILDWQLQQQGNASSGSSLLVINLTVDFLASVGPSLVTVPFGVNLPSDMYTLKVEPSLENEKPNPSGFLSGIYEPGSSVNVTRLNDTILQLTFASNMGTQFNIEEDEEVGLYLKPSYFTTRCQPKTTLTKVGLLQVRAAPDASILETKTAFTVVTSVSALAGGAGGAVMDAQTLAVISLFSCTQPAEKRATRNNRLLSPFGLDDSFEGMIVGNWILVGVAISLHLSVVVCFRFICCKNPSEADLSLHPGKSPSIAKWLQAMGFTRFPAFSLQILSLQYQGTAAASIRLLQSAFTPGRGLGLAGITIIICLLTPFFFWFVAWYFITAKFRVYVYADDANAKSLVGKLSQEHINASVKVPRWMRGILAPGKWTPPHTKRMFGNLFGGLGRHEKLWTNLTTWSPTIVIVGLMFQPSTNAGCSAQFGAMAGVEVILVFVVLFFRPYRTLISNILSASSYFCLALVLAGNSWKASDPNNNAPSTFILRVVQIQMTVTVLRLFWAVFQQCFEYFVMRRIALVDYLPGEESGGFFRSGTSWVGFRDRTQSSEESRAQDVLNPNDQDSRIDFQLNRERLQEDETFNDPAATGLLEAPSFRFGTGGEVEMGPVLQQQPTAAGAEQLLDNLDELLGGPLLPNASSTTAPHVHFTADHHSFSAPPTIDLPTGEQQNSNIHKLGEQPLVRDHFSEIYIDDDNLLLLSNNQSSKPEGGVTKSRTGGISVLATLGKEQLDDFNCLRGLGRRPSSTQQVTSSFRPPKSVSGSPGVRSPYAQTSENLLDYNPTKVEDLDVLAHAML